MKEYVVKRADRPVPLSANHEETPWERANQFDVNSFSWHEAGPKPRTVGRLLYDADALYLWFDVEDHHIEATVTELNGPTYRDSSVEFFSRPNPESNEKYFNFEANCCGQFKFAWQEPGWQERGIDRDLISSDLAAGVAVETSVPRETREPKHDDESWWLAAEIPFSVLTELTGIELAPSKDTCWRANFYRSGVQSDSQKATWNRIEKPDPAYHSPEYFGRLRFD